MPNHVINILNIDGDKDKVAKMLSEIQNDEYGIGSIDFEKIIPMPESLRIEAGSSTTRGLKAYKDFVSVYTFAGANADKDLYNTLFVEEKVFKNKAEAMKDREEFINHPDQNFAKFLDDIFGDG